MATPWFPAYTLAEANRLDSYDFNRKFQGLNYAVFNFTQPQIYPFKSKLVENQWWSQDEWLLEATDPHRCLYLSIHEDINWPVVEEVKEILYSPKTRFCIFKVAVICGPEHPTVKMVTEQEELRATSINSQARWCTIENRIYAMMFYFDSTETAMLAKLAADDRLRSVNVENYRGVFGGA